MTGEGRVDATSFDGKVVGAVIDLAQAVRGLGDGEEIVILSDDAAFPLDLRAWCAGTGHELLDLASEGRQHRATIRKRSKD